jgi:DUF4097 and DUF4098 domain-containing protein YvlB
MRSWDVRLLAGLMVAVSALGLDLPGARLRAEPALSGAEGQRLLDQPRGWTRGSSDRGPQETETVDRTVALPANGALRIKNFSGNIRITPASGRDVVLKATRRASRDTLDHVKLDVSSSASGVTIEANWRDPSWARSRNEGDVVDTQMELQVPASADLDIDAFSSDVTVEGMNADQRIKTFSGTIVVRGLKGEIDAETFSADIRVTLDAASKGSVSFDSFSGRLDSDLAISSMLTERSNRRGRRSRNVEGTLPGGAGPRLRFHTFSGDVELRKS